jgi:hypothetical protein
MNPNYKSILGTLSALMLTGASLLPTGAFAQEAGAENVQVLTRGPVHEAFAESINYDPQPGLVISTRMPDPIEELPPEQKPDGDNVTWISGYWAWDEDQNDFIWISGIWRNLPPGRQWVPGYWNGIDDGKYQWTSGYWADATTEEVSYVSTAPPRSVDAGPNVEAPSSDHSWIPGNWFWVDSRYAWRPGYWLPLRTNWTWVPSRYCWTRRGYVFVDGYWDYSVARRGVLFAPVHFRERVYAEPNYFYTPLIVVGLNVFSNHLFVRPRYGQYYFGDYYALRYQTSGFYASYSWGTSRGGYDPIYAYDRWENRADRGWDRRRQDDFNYFRNNEDARPPRTWAAMRDYREDRFNDGRNRTYATPLATFVQEPSRMQSFRTLDQGARQQFVSQNREMRNFSQERRQTESREVAAGAAEPGRGGAVQERTRRSPITGREADRFSEKEAPPKRPEARGNKTEMRPAGRETPQANADRGQEARKSDNRQESGADPKAGRGAAQARPGRSEEGTPQRSGREVNPSNKEVPDRQAQQREERTRPQGQPTPTRQGREAEAKPTERKAQETQQREERARPPSQSAPERKTQSKPTPQRESRQAAPQPTQQRKAQEAPQRQAQPQAQPTPQRQSRQAAPQPTQQRKAQEAPQRKAQQQAQPAPQRQARQAAPQPTQQRKAQEAPQRQAQPRQQAAPPTPEQKDGKSEEEKKKRR